MGLPLRHRSVMKLEGLGEISGEKRDAFYELYTEIIVLLLEDSHISQCCRVF